MSIFSNYLDFCKNHEERYFIEMEKDIKYIILKKIININSKDKEDLYQEIMFKIFQKMKEGAFVLEDLSEYFAIMKAQKVISNKKIKDCLINFLTYQPNQVDYKLYLENKKSNFEYQFKMFIGSGRLRYYLSKIAEQIIRDFVVKSKMFSISLNSLNDKGLEYIDTIAVEMTELPMSISDIEILSNEDKQFLYHFIDNHNLLTQKEVAKKLGLTQQAISMRKNTIIKKLKSTAK